MCVCAYVSLPLYLLQEQARKLRDKSTETPAREQMYTAWILAICMHGCVYTHLWSQMKGDWAGCSPECCLESHPRVATHSWGEGCRRAGRDGDCGDPHMDQTGCSLDWHTTEEEWRMRGKEHLSLDHREAEYSVSFHSSATNSLLWSTDMFNAKVKQNGCNDMQF